MPDDINTDVPQVETTTEAPSAANQTEETTQEVTQDDSTQAKTVPYERFEEVNKKYRELERQRQQELQQQQRPVETKPIDPNDQAINQELERRLKDMGFISKQELEQKEADRNLETTIDKLSEKYNGKDGRPKFDKQAVLEYASQNLIGNVEIAYKQMHEAELMDYAVKQAMGKIKGTKSETSDGSSTSQHSGASKDSLLEAAANGDEDAINTLAMRALKS